MGFLIPAGFAALVVVFFSAVFLSELLFDLGLSAAADLAAAADLGLSVAADLGFSEALDLGAVAIVAR